MFKTKQIALGVLLVMVGAGGFALYRVQANYYAKVSVAEAVKFAEGVALSVDKYRREHQKFPESLENLTMPTGEVGYIPRVTIDMVTGVLTIYVESSHGQYGDLRLIPSQPLPPSQPLLWRCKNDSVAHEILPDRCR